MRTIRSEGLFQCDELAQLPVVKELEKVSELKLLYRLICIFARETYAEYSAFAASAEGGALLKKHDLDAEACAKKMRLLTLVTLGQGEKALAYATIAGAHHARPPSPPCPPPTRAAAPILAAHRRAAGRLP